MAIQDSFNLNNALDSQSYAYKCWYNYNYGNNTMGISSKDMSKITQTWSGELSNWKAIATDDENAYEIEDDDFSKAVKKGKDNGKDATGFSGKTGGMWTRTAAVDSASAVAGTVMTTAPVVAKAVGSAVKKVAGKITGKAAAKEASKEVAKEATKEATKEASKEVGKEAAKEVGKEAGKKGSEAAAKESTKKAGASAWITAGLVIATTAAYLAKKPNKTQKEACDDLQDEMKNAQDAAMSAQKNMADMRDELIDYSEEAAMYNEDTNEDIKKQKTVFDSYKPSYEELMSKIESGEPLTEDEKALLQELIPTMDGLKTSIGEMSKETTEAVGEIFDEMDTYQDGYDDAAETIGEIEGLTDYAESFDEATRTSCYIEAAAQGLNAANGATSGARLCATAGLNIGQWIMGGAAIAAGATSGAVGVTQQLSWAGEVGTEIGMREATQDLNSLTSDIYDESIADYEGYMFDVEDLELEIPDDM